MPIAENHELQAIEPSPPNELSPVTINNLHQSHSDDLRKNVVSVETNNDSVADATPVVTETVITDVANQTDNHHDESGIVSAVNAVSIDHSQEMSATTPTFAFGTQKWAGATTDQIDKGVKVRVHFPGSKRHNKLGVVASLIYEHGVKKAVVILENIESELKHFLCPLPGSELMRLFLVS